MAKTVAAIPVVDARREALEKQAHDLGEARKALESATGIARGLWFTFMSLTAYLVIAVGSVSHRDLFLEKALPLPILGVDLPLVTFFGVVPVIFVIIHAYLLLNLKFMSDNAQNYFGAVDEFGLDADAERKLFLQLPNFLILQMLIVRRQEKWGFMGFATHLAVVLTVIVVPLLLLLLIQLQFLPYHSEPVTFIHRLAVVADMVLLVVFWPKIAGETKSRRVGMLRLGIWALLIFVLTFSAGVATFPGESAREYTFPKLASIAQQLFHSPVHEVRGKRELWFSDTLVLTDADFVSGDEDKAPAGVTVSLRGRDLAGAYLARTDLRGADFTGADLSGTNFRDAKLLGAQFGCPVGQAQGKERSHGHCTNLNDATLNGADMRGVYMRQVKLQNANFTGTRLDGANLEGAQARGALFKSASLLKINMSNADLTGAKFENSDLSNAKLVLTTFAATSLQNVSLQGGDLTDARLQAPALMNVNIHEMKADGVEWTSALIQDIQVSAAEFVINQPAQPFNTTASAVRGLQDLNAFSVAGAETEDVSTTVKAKALLNTIVDKAVVSRGDGDIETDPTRWEPRLKRLDNLLCGRKDSAGANAIFSRLSSLPGSSRPDTQPNSKNRENNMRLAFGPDSESFIGKLFAPTCMNAAALKQNVCFVLAYWSPRGSTPRKECVD